MTADPGAADATTSARFSLGDLAPRPAGGPSEPAVLGGRYVLGRLLGSGGSSRVYRAYDRRLRRDVAVKVYDREAIPVEESRRIREMSIHGNLDHPAVVPLHDCGTEDGWTYLVMQCVEGQNLAERLRTGPLPTDEVTALAITLAAALAYLHAREVTHRDLKPANVLLGADGPLLTDFGIASALDESRVTSTGTVPGTAAYMAPEQVRGEPAGPPADLYALGLVLLECLTGEREYPGTMAESAVARLTRQPRIPGDLPAPLARALAQMTALAPGDRPTADEVHLLLTKPDTVPLPRQAPRARHAFVTAGLTAAAGVIVLPFLFSGSATHETVLPATTTPSSPPPSSPAEAAPASSGSPVSTTRRPAAIPATAPGSPGPTSDSPSLSQESGPVTTVTETTTKKKKKKKDPTTSAAPTS